MIKVFNFGFNALTVLNLKSKVILVFPEARCKVKHHMNLCQAQVYIRLFTFVSEANLRELFVQVLVTYDFLSFR